MTAPARKSEAGKERFREIDQIIEEASETGFALKSTFGSGDSSYAILSFSGSFENKDARVLRKILSPLNRRPVENVIIDLTRVDNIVSAPLATLLMFVKEREPLRYALASPLIISSKCIISKFKTLGLEPLFEIYPTMDEALAMLRLNESDGKNLRTRIKMITKAPRTAIVTLMGSIQEREASGLFEIFEKLGLRGARKVIVDLECLSYANLSAIKVFFNLARIWHETFGERAMAFTGADAKIREMLNLLGGQVYFHLAVSVSKALELFKPPEYRKKSTPVSLSTRLRTKEA